MPAAIIAIITQVLTLLPQLIAAGLEVAPLIQSTIKALSSGSADPTDEQWAAVNAILDQNTALLNQDPPAA